MATVFRGDELLYVVLAGPSGSGKSTIARRLVSDFSDLTLSISYTTRAPRPGEQHGREYYFTDRDHFGQMVSRGEFLEWAHVHGNLYGTHGGTVEAARGTYRG